MTPAAHPVAAHPVAAHPVADLIRAAAAGRFPPVDGGWHRVVPWRAGVEAVLAFTGHAVLAVGDDVDDTELDALGVDGFGGAHHPRVVAAIAGSDGWIDSLDAVLVSTGTGTPAAESTGTCTPAAEPGGIGSPAAEPGTAGLDHSRIRFAAALRDDVRARLITDADGPLGVVTAGRGLGGLTEVSLEAEPGRRGGAGVHLVQAAQALVPAGETVVAAVAPGNAASLRAFLRAGFVPVGSVQMIRPARANPLVTGAS